MPASLKPFMESPGDWGAEAVAAWLRPEAPTAPFQVVEGSVRPDQRYAVLKREHVEGQRHTDVVPGDMLLHTQTGIVGRCVQRINPWDFRFEAWSPPDGEDELAYFEAHNCIGEWVVWGYGVMAGETYPQGFPYRPAESIDSHNPDGSFNPEYVEAYKDVNPGTRKNLKPLGEDDRVRFKTPEEFTKTDITTMAEARAEMDRFVSGEGVGKIIEKLSTPLDSSGDVEVVSLTGDKKKKSRSTSFPGQKKRS